MSVDVLYAINAKTEPAGSLSPEITGVPATLTDSSIGIADLLTYVNRYFPDVLPESVLRHFGHSERPAGKLGEGATAVSGAELCERLFQSTPPRGGRRQRIALDASYQNISIHAPREGGDRKLWYWNGACAIISIHAPREGGDPIRERPLPAPRSNFNPRPPARGATAKMHSFTCGSLTNK